MKRAVLFVAALAAVSGALAGFKYEGEWGKPGTGDGEFIEPRNVAVAPGGDVYVANRGRVQYFTRAGSFLGKWAIPAGEFGVAVAPSKNVYVAGGGSDVIRYYTRYGTLLGSWTAPSTSGFVGVDVAPNGNVYTVVNNHVIRGVWYYTPSGSLLGSWGCREGHIGVAPDGDVYVSNYSTGRVTRYSASGSLRGYWGVSSAAGIDVAPDRRVFVAISDYDHIRYYTASGSLLGSWGGEGSRPGKFISPEDVHFSRDGEFVYVADRYNHRIQYFSDEEFGVHPASLGRVKAVFK